MKPALIRKQETERNLFHKGIKVDTKLPLLEEAGEVTIRNEKEILDRAIALFITAAKTMGAPHYEMTQMMVRLQAFESFTNQEKAFLSSVYPSREEGIRYSWRVEGVWALLWSIQLLPTLREANDLCHVPSIHDLLSSTAYASLVKRARLRDKEEILDEMDYTYRLHWSIRGKTDGSAAAFNEDVVFERHYAFNWLISGSCWEEAGAPA